MGTGRPPGRHARLAAIGAAGALLAIPWPAAATAAEPPVISDALDRRLADAAPGEPVPVIVTLADQVDAARYEGRPGALILALKRASARGRDDVDPELGETTRRFWLVNAHALRATPEEVALLAEDPDVGRIDLDPPVRAVDLLPSAVPDTTPGLGNWGLEATGVSRARAASGSSGRGVVVGSIDTGVDADHPQLGGRVVAFRDFVHGRVAPYDDNGHGTHTVGTMIGSDVAGVAIGVAPGATAVVAKAMNASGVGAGSDLLAAAEWMTDPDGDPSTHDQPDVINNSWSASGPTDPWFRSMIRRWTELGIVPVFAVGNTGPGASTIGSPASYPESIAVGATDADGAVASFSARGPVVWVDGDGLGPASGTSLTKPDLVAPGTSITSTGPGGFLTYTGTSMASPHVAGVVALMRERAPDLPPASVASILRATARDTGAPGRDPAAGAGMLDAAAALAAVADPAPETTIVFAPPAATRSRAVAVGVRSTAGDRARYRVDGGAWSAPVTLPAIRVPLPDEGEHAVEVQALSPRGIVDPTPAAVTVTVDRTPPRVRLGWRRRGDRATFVARAMDELSPIRPALWAFGRGVRRTGGRVAVRFLAPGRRTVTVTVRDAAGNRARVRRRFTPVVTTPVRRLRVRSAATAVRVSGRLARPGRLDAVLQPLGPVSARAGTLTAQAGPRGGVARRVRRAARRGRFALALPTRHLAPGRYRVRLIARERGRPAAAPLVRVVEIRARGGDAAR